MIRDALGLRPERGYAGMYRHATTGLYLTHYRAYSPEYGRWLSRDPVHEAGGNNLYGYVGGNPVSFTDPKGLYWFQQPWQAQDPIVGREGTIIYPGGAVSTFIEEYVPAGRTLAEIHDPLVDTLTDLGVPDVVANIPTMPSAYGAAIGLEILRSLSLVEQPKKPEMCEP